MTDALAEIRSRQREWEEMAKEPGIDVELLNIRTAHAVSYKTAADLIEASPVYKAGKAALTLVRKWSAPGHVPDYTRREECDKILAALPKEGT